MIVEWIANKLHKINKKFGEMTTKVGDGPYISGNTVIVYKKQLKKHTT